MSKLLVLLLSLTLSGSAVTAAAALMARLLGRRAPGWFRYYLWLPAVLSFLLPLGLSRYPVQGQAVYRPLPQYVQETAQTGEGTGDWYGSAAPEEAGRTGTGLQTHRVVETALLVWAGGVAVTLGWRLSAYGRFRRRVLGSVQAPQRWERELLLELAGEGPAPELLRCGGMEGPMLLGLWHSRLVLPREPYDRETLEDILAHELCHWRRHDLWIKWLSVLAACMHWFNPAAWWLAGKVGRDCELACDEAVLRGRDTKRRLRYGNTLLLVASKNLTGAGGLTAPMVSQKEQLKERIESMMQRKKLGKGTAAALCAAGLMVALATVSFGTCLNVEQKGQPAGAEVLSSEEQAGIVGQPGPEGLEGTDAQAEVSTPDVLEVPVRMEKLVLSALCGGRVHPVTGQAQDHTGIDIVAPAGQPVYAAAEGRVTDAGYDLTMGNYVELEHGSWKTVYGHMSQVLVEQGEKVDSQTQIGAVGSTGMSTGAHLHFELWKDGLCADPLDDLNLESVWVRANGTEEEYQIG